MGDRGMDLSGSAERLVTQAYEHDKENLVSIKLGKFLEQLKICFAHDTFLVKHTILQIEIPSLIRIWVSDSPSVKMLVSTKKIQNVIKMN